MTPTAFIIHDDPVTRKSLADALEPASVPAETYDSAQDFLSGFDAARAGCVICEARSPGTHALALLERLRLANSDIPVLLLITPGDVRTAVRAMRGGAFDALEMPVSDEDLRGAVREAFVWESSRQPDRAEEQHVRRRFDTLSDRERQVLTLMLDGLPTPEMAARLGISRKTVEAHRGNVLRKIEVRDVTHLVRLSLRYRVTAASRHRGAPPDAAAG